jgi:HEAT repeat protein
MASFALRELAPDLPQAAQALLAATHDDDRDVRRAAVTALAGLLDPPAEVAERLAALRADPDEILARLATLANARIDAGRDEEKR